MKLLVITQKVDINDDNLGFFHKWLEKFSARLDKLYVICLWKGEYRLPDNVEVLSLGKENGFSKLKQFFRLQKILLKTLPVVDGVFIHMSPIYVITSFPLVKIFRKKMMLWFLHKSLNWKLKLAEKLVDNILTASEESNRLKNRKKIKILGHGIDIDQFKQSELITSSLKLRILSVGRIAPSKDLETLIHAIDILINQKSIRDIEIKIIGSPLEDSEKKYFERLKFLVQEKNLQNYIEFLGGVPHREMSKYYQNSDLVVNLSHTGSIDKIVLEAMISGCLVLTCNEAFETILDPKYLFKKKDSEGLAQMIIKLKGVEKDKSLKEIVVKYHNLDNLIDKIILGFHV